MDIQKFIEARPYLYHLTSKENAEIIKSEKRLYSANELIRMSNNESHLPIQRQKRQGHYELIVNGQSRFLRDQQPISEKALAKCLTDDWAVGDFLYHLNDRVFMWPTLDRLWRHFNRYKEEEPIIFRFSTREILEKNPHAKFCRLNSGATRPNSYLGGIAPQRGATTFLSAADYKLPVGSVAEVTFESYCDVNFKFHCSNAPDLDFALI